MPGFSSEFDCPVIARSRVGTRTEPSPRPLLFWCRCVTALLAVGFLWTDAQPASPDAKPLRIVHISDIHASRAKENPGPRFPGDPVPKDLVNSLDILQHAVAVTNQRLNADLVVVTGDLVDGRKDTTLHQEVKARLQRLTCPYYVVIGNHDHRETFKKQFPGRINYSFDRGGWHFVAVDSAHKTLEPETLEWLKSDLTKAKGRPTILMLHHPFVVPEDANPLTRELHRSMLTLKNSDEVQVLLRGYPDVKLALCGHTHLADSRTWAGICCMTAPGLVVPPHNVCVLDVSQQEIKSHLISVYRAPQPVPQQADDQDSPPGDAALPDAIESGPNR